MSWIVIEPGDRKVALQMVARLVLRRTCGIGLLVERWREEFIGRIGLRCTRTAVLWCRAMHKRVTWPVYGRYHCRQCHRTYTVPWDWRLGEPP